MILAESSDCGATVGRFLCSDAGCTHENTVISSNAPHWATQIVVQVMERVGEREGEREMGGGGAL